MPLPINNRPRKGLGIRSPLAIYRELLLRNIQVGLGSVPDVCAVIAFACCHHRVYRCFIFRINSAKTNILT